MLRCLEDVESAKAATKAAARRLAEADKEKQWSLDRANWKAREARERELRRLRYRRALELHASGMTYIAIGREIGSVKDASKPISVTMVSILVGSAAKQILRRGDESDPLWAVAAAIVAKHNPAPLPIWAKPVAN